MAGNKKLTKTNSIRKKVNKRAAVFIGFVYLAFLLLIARLAWIQFVHGAEYKEMAYRQQTINELISPKRGTIYDTKGNALAISADVDTVTVNPGKIKYRNGKEVEASIVAKALSEIFTLDEQETLEKVTDTDSSFVTIVKKVEKEKITQLKEWMTTEKITAGINIDADTKRYYPYTTLAAQLIGFCGTDAQGLEGLEAAWQDVLTGTPGKIVTSANGALGARQEVPNSEQTYIPAENGSNLILTLDTYIQNIAEKYLEQAVTENKCTRGGNVIIMSPETGDILAMATYPTYDLNNPFEPYQNSLKEIWDTLDSNQKYAEWNKMWRNKAASDSYEPGSTFKLVTTAIALEEGITTPEIKDEFLCTGKEIVAGEEIECWRDIPHGPQTLKEALQNSCNPAFMQLGKRIGVRNFYKYFSAFGFFDRPNSGLAGETAGIFHNEDAVGASELATASFGQRIKISPLQLITAICAISNDGILMQPRIVKEIVNTDTGSSTSLDPVAVRQVISKETSETMRKLMESVVTDGTGRYASVSGYSVGGKTGTSEPDPNKEEEGYTASYVAISPTAKPKVAVLVILYDPKGDSHQGGQIAGPVVSQILSEVLPYMGLGSSEGAKQTDSDEVTLVDVRNRTVTEAKKILRDSGFRVQSGTISNENEILVTDQVPKPGISLAKDSIIYLYTPETDASISTTVPNLKGMSLSQATNSLKAKNLNISYEGVGTVIAQSVAVDSNVEVGTIIHVTLQTHISDTY